MFPSRLKVKVEGDKHPDNMVLPLLVSQAEPIRLLCFLSAPPVHVSRKRVWRSRAAHLNEEGVEESCCKL